MDALVDDTNRRIARRLRLERETRGWSLADLAARSGVGKATISKIEREETSPTAAVLVRLAAAIDLTLAGLLVKAEGDDGRLVRATDQAVWTDPATGYRRRQLFLRADHPMELVDVEMPPGQSVTLAAASYTLIRQILWVRDGRLVVCEPGRRYELAPGDCLAFGQPADVTIANESAACCRYVIALTRS
ncbi:MAG: helix-turn-helix domain-containing protein [Ancalomicrobiaceae bacterium]|nr:helix-turn-helix domain-containing protein [Ancalomicrobiaceae bacterium]